MSRALWEMRQSGHFRTRTKIVCTIGPATCSPRMVERLIRAGMSVARLNLSHGTLQEHSRYAETIRRVSQRLGVPVAILMDLPGPKYRVGRLAEPVTLKKGALLTLTPRQASGERREVPINLDTLSQGVKPGDTVLLDDGAMELKVKALQGGDVLCTVVVGGTLTSGRGIAVPGMRSIGPFVTEQLKGHIAFAAEQGPDFVALSFVSSAQDVEQAREALHQRDAHIPIISKIERRAALSDFARVLEASDGIMVARGDLGVDIPLDQVPIVQKGLIEKCNRAGKPVITATQMLESMVKAASPSRAEVTDVANAIFDGTDAVMLSSETSIGSYPIAAVRMMARVALTTERALPYPQLLSERGQGLKPHTDEAISYTACHTASQLGAAAIVAFTYSGSTAQRVSKYRPQAPILAVTPNEHVGRRLLLCWGVRALSMGQPSSIEEMFALGATLPRELGIARPGDLVVITGGLPIGIAGTTNLLKVERVP